MFRLRAQLALIWMERSERCTTCTSLVSSHPLFESAPALTLLLVNPVDGAAKITSCDFESYRVTDSAARPRTRLRSMPASSSRTRSGEMFGLPTVPEA